MACAELEEFATATEHLEDRILRSPRLGRAKFWWNAVPHGTFIKNKGVTATTFSMKPSEPVDDSAAWTDITLDGTSGQPTPSCSAAFEDIDVGFYRRTYGPKRRDFRGPVLCKRDFTFQHDIDEFLNGYVDEMGRYIMRAWEFALRSDYMAFGDIFVDYTKYPGPHDTLAGIPIPKSSLEQAMLDDIAADLIDVGAGIPDEMGYVMDGDTAPIFTLYIGNKSSAGILTNNSDLREDARFASMGKSNDDNLALIRALGANRVIGNFRHRTTDIPPRANNVGGTLVPVTPFKDVNDITSNGETLTAAYKAARYEAAIVVVRDVMQADIVTPSDWRFPTTANYTGSLDFVIGGEKICNPAVYDPQGERGRHFANLEYAPKPKRPYYAKTIWFKRCPTSNVTNTCASYT